MAYIASLGQHGALGACRVALVLLPAFGKSHGAELVGMRRHWHGEMQGLRVAPKHPGSKKEETQQEAAQQESGRQGHQPAPATRRGALERPASKRAVHGRHRGKDGMFQSPKKNRINGLSCWVCVLPRCQARGGEVWVDPGNLGQHGASGTAVVMYDKSPSAVAGAKPRSTINLVRHGLSTNWIGRRSR